MSITRRIAQAWIVVVCATSFALYAMHNIIKRPGDELLLLVLGAYIIGVFTLLKKKASYLIPFEKDDLFRRYVSWKKVLAVFTSLGIAFLIAYIAMTGDINALHLVELELNAFRIMLVYGGMILAWFFLGNVIVEFFGISFSKSVQKIVFSVVAGIAFMILLYYLLVYSHFVSLWPLILCAGAAAFYTLTKQNTALRDVFSPMKNEDQQDSLQLKKLRALCIRATLAIAFMVFINVASFAPHDGDSLRAYYAIPKQMVEQNGPVEYRFDAFNNSPLASSYLYIPFILIGDDYVGYVNAFLLILLIATVYCLAKEYFSERTAIFAGTITLSIYLLLFHAITTRTDLLLVLLVLWSIFFVWRSLDDTALFRKPLFIAGALLGIAMAVKYSVIVILPPLVVVILLYTRHVSWKKRAFNSLVLVAAFMVAYSFWGVPLALRYHGDFLYPALTTYFTTHDMELFRKFYDEFKVIQYSERADLSLTHNLYALFSNTATFPNNKLGPLIAAAFLLIPLKLRSRRVQILSVMLYGSAFIWYILVPQEIWIVYSIILAAIGMGFIIEKYVPARFYGALVILFAYFAIFQPPLGNLKMIKYRFSNREADYPVANTVYGAEKYLNEHIEKDEPNYAVLPIGFLRDGLVHDSYKHSVPILFYVLSPHEWYIPQWAGPLLTDEPFALVRENLLIRGITHLYIDKKYLSSVVERACAQNDCTIIRRIDRHVQEAVAELVPIVDNDNWSLYRL